MELRRFFEEEAEREPADFDAMVDALDRHFRRGAQVALCRRSLGWTQLQLADKAGMAQSEISRIERGRGNPTEETWGRLADALGMTWESRLVPKGERSSA